MSHPKLQAKLAMTDVSVARLELAENHFELWQQWHASSNPIHRLQLIEVYLPFARSIAAKRYAQRGPIDIAFEDYLHHAIVGLIESIDRYDVALGVPFSAFSRPRIEGCILNAVPSFSEIHAQMDFQARIRRERLESLRLNPDVQHDVHSLDNNDFALTDSLEVHAIKHHRSSDSIFAELVETALGLSIAFMLDGLALYQHPDATVPEFGYASYEREQWREPLQWAIAELAVQARAVVKCHYLYGMIFEDVAKFLGLSKGRVSQIHKQALLQLKAHLQKQGLVMDC